MHFCFVVEASHIQGEQEQGSLNQEITVKARIIRSKSENAAEHIEGKKVLFAVRSQDEAKCLAIANAIVDVHNIWIKGIGGHQAEDGNEIRPHGCWAPNADKKPPLNTEYIYVYATPDIPNSLNFDNIFYIGRGVKDRWLDHINQAHKKRQLAADVNALDFLKIKKINKSLQERGMENNRLAEKKQWAQLNMVRRIAHFYGDYAKERCDAVENFLINYWIGVFDLANENRGYSNFEKNDFEWITYPRAILDIQPWTDIVRIFCNGQSVTQGPSNQLLAQEINSVFSRGEWSWRPVQVLNSANPATRLEPILPEFTTNNTDVFFGYRLLKENESYLILHLKNKKSGTGVCINLRRVDRSETLESFVAKIREIFFSGDREALWDIERYIKDKRNDPYFKPCANLGNGKQEVNFDLRNLANSSIVKTGAPLLQGFPDRGITLNQALQMIVNLAEA